MSTKEHNILESESLHGLYCNVRMRLALVSETIWNTHELLSEESPWFPKGACCPDLLSGLCSSVPFVVTLLVADPRVIFGASPYTSPFVDSSLSCRSWRLYSWPQTVKNGVPCSSSLSICLCPFGLL
jgi:hypothetical protein